MHIRLVVAASVLVVSGVAAAIAQGQAPQNPQRPVFRSDAHFVIVDAYPIRDGKVVEGLTAADFVGKEDGVPQAIDTFEFIAGAPPEPESSRREPNTITESREMAADPRSRAFVVDLDIDHVSIPGSHRIRVPLVRMLNEMLAPNDLFGVISTEHDPGTITFARKVTTAEDMLARYWSWGMRDTLMTDAEEEGIINCFEVEMTASGPVERTVEDGARVRKLPDVLIEKYRESKVLDHLDDLVDVLGHMREGRTTVVLVTEGWRLSQPDTRLLAQVERTQLGGVRVGPATLAGQVVMVDSITQGARDACILMGQRLVRTDHRQRLRDLIARANQRNVTFIPVNPAGLVVFDSPISEQVRPVGDISKSVLVDDFDRVTMREDGLRTLADNTDGMAVVKNNDLQAGLKKVTDQMRSFYLIGYYSSNKTFDGGTRTISVETRARDVEVKARRGYKAPTAADRDARANPVAAAGPSAVEKALDVLSGVRAADDRGYNMTRYLRADAEPVLGAPVVSRGTPSPRSPLVPVTSPAFTRHERLHAEWAIKAPLTERSARVLGRNGKPLALQVTLTEREGPDGSSLVADAVLGPLAPGDYVLEVRVSAAAGTKTTMLAFRVVP